MDKNINKMETTQKETLITQNMLIAQFMEIKPRLIAPDCYGLDNMPFWSITGDTPDKVLKDASLLLKYHNDWNQLMEVVDKIESFQTTLKLTSNFNPFHNQNYHQVTIEIAKGKLSESKECFWGNGFIYKHHSKSSLNRIDCYYESIIEFIKWYNKNK